MDVPSVELNGDGRDAHRTAYSYQPPSATPVARVQTDGTSVLRAVPDFELFTVFVFLLGAIVAVVVAFFS